MKSILKRAFSKFGNPRYYTLLRLIFLSAIKPKNKGGKIRLHGKQIQYNDMNALMGMYHEIHYKEHYRFPSKNPKPVIIDCGANIGISALYFHEQFPGVNLIAIEADPQVAALLQRNLSSNNCKAEIIQKAAWTSNDSYLNFGQAGADAGSIYASANTIQVPTMRFKELLQQHDSIELIKIDIEGAELDVIEDCHEELHRAKYVFIEFHSFPGKAQHLERILDLVAKQGFRYKILQARHEDKPFMQHIDQQQMDVQLNIFFTKM